VPAIDVDLSRVVVDSLDHCSRQGHPLPGQRRHRVDRDEARNQLFCRPVDRADRPLEVLGLVADDVGADGLLADSLQIERQHFVVLVPRYRRSHTESRAKLPAPCCGED
jgi:hypothetical protein